jgi:hypothetical protein
VVPILMKEGPKSLIRAPLLAVVVAWHVPESDNVPWTLFVVVDLFPVGVDFRGVIFKHSSSLGELGVPPRGEFSGEDSSQKLLGRGRLAICLFLAAGTWEEEPLTS